MARVTVSDAVYVSPFFALAGVAQDYLVERAMWYRADLGELRICINGQVRRIVTEAV